MKKLRMCCFLELFLSDSHALLCPLRRQYQRIQDVTFFSYHDQKKCRKIVASCLSVAFATTIFTITQEVIRLGQVREGIQG